MASGKGYGEESSWFCSDPWSRENGYHSLSMSSHHQIRDKLKGHLQVVKAQGQDESVNPEESCQAVTHSVLLQALGFRSKTKPCTSTESSQLTRAAGHSGAHLVRGGPLKSLGREWQFPEDLQLRETGHPHLYRSMTSQHLTASKALSQAIFPFTKM